MAYKVERILGGMTLGKGPHWDDATQSLYFADIFAKEIHKYTPSNNKHTKVVISGEKTASFLIPVEGHKDKFVTTQERSIAVVQWDGESDKISCLETLAEVDVAPELQTNKLNDGKCDSSGRLWTGTVSEFDIDTLQVTFPIGSLYSLGPNKTLKKHVSKIGVSNGLAWNVQNNKFYYIDSTTHTVVEYDFDVATGEISNPKVVYTLSDSDMGPALPDGMTIDTDGNLWIAVFNGHSVIKIDPRKPQTLLETIKLPAKQVTSVIFGGPNLDELYVTSGNLTVKNQVLSRPENGALYRITGTGCKGYMGVPFKM